MVSSLNQIELLKYSMFENALQLINEAGEFFTLVNGLEIPLYILGVIDKPGEKNDHFISVFFSKILIFKSQIFLVVMNGRRRESSHIFMSTICQNSAKVPLTSH